MVQKTLITKDLENASDDELVAYIFQDKDEGSKFPNVYKGKHLTNYQKIGVVDKEDDLKKIINLMDKQTLQKSEFKFTQLRTLL